MKGEKRGRHACCQGTLWVAVLAAVVLLASAGPLLASWPEIPTSGGNSQIGKNDVLSGDPIVTGSGSIDYSLPLFNLGGPMGLSFSYAYNRAILNWWGEITQYFPTHGGMNYFWLPPLSSSVNWDDYYDVRLPEGGMVSFLKDGDSYRLNEADIGDEYRENGSAVRYGAKTTGNPANRFWVQDPIRDVVFVYEYKAYAQEGKILYALDRKGNKLTYAYDGNGRVAEISDGLGRKLGFSYTPVGAKSYLHQVSDATDGANPRTVTFAYDEAAADMGGQPALRSITDPLGHVYTLRWSVVSNSGDDYYGNLAKVENPKGATYFHFENAWGFVGYENAEGDPRFGIKVVSQKDAYANETAFTYNGDPYETRAAYPDGGTGAYAHNNAHVPPSKITDSENKAIDLTKNDRNQVTSMTDRTGGLTQATYHDKTGEIASVTNAKDEVLTYTYTAQNQSFADPDVPANTVDFTFYNLTKIDYPDGTSETFTYDATGNVLTYTDRTGKTWNYTYNDRGQVLTATNPEGGVTTYTYNADATLATSTDSDTGATQYAYDGYKRLTRITHPGGSFIQIAYDLNNQVASITDERNKKYDYAYDANGNLVSITDPDTKQTLFSHDFMDRVKETTNARTKKTEYAYDTMNRLQSVTDPNSNAIQYGYNSRGWLNKVTDAAGHEWTTGFDNEGLPTYTTTPMNRTTTITRDALGYVSNLKNPLNQETVFTRDEMSRVTKITDAFSRETSFSYDNAGRLTGVTLPLVGSTTYRRNGLGLVDRITDLKGSVWDLTYTDMGRLASLTDPLSKGWQYGYDTRGRLNQVTYPGNATQTRTYDDAGNLLRSLYSTGPDLNFTYDNQNRLLTAKDIAFSYNEIGQVTATTNPGTTFGATYDDGGRVKTVTYANGLFAVAYTYDERDLVTKVTDNLTSTVIDFTYDNDGRLTGITRSNGINTAFAWDAASRLTRVQHGALADLQYTYNAVGEVTRLDYDLPLDPADYLTSGTDSFTYDAASQVKTAGYAYDNQGRQTASPGQTYTWDGATRLSATVDANLTYNGLNDLLTRQTGGTTIHYYYNYALNLHPIVAEYNETTGSWKRFYVLTPVGKLLYLIDAANGNAVSFYHYDHIGNTIFLTNAAGAITDKYAYNPYGKLLAHEGASDQPFTFVGARQVRQEGRNGLYQMRARFYDAFTGRFLSREPLWPRMADPLSLNSYHYARMNPISFADVTGNFARGAQEIFNAMDRYAMKLSDSQLKNLVAKRITEDVSFFSEEVVGGDIKIWGQIALGDRLDLLARLDPEVAKRFLKALIKKGKIGKQEPEAETVPKPAPKDNEFQAKPALLQVDNNFSVLEANQMLTHLGEKEAIGKLGFTWFYGGANGKGLQPTNQNRKNEFRRFDEYRYESESMKKERQAEELRRGLTDLIINMNRLPIDLIF